MKLLRKDRYKKEVGTITVVEMVMAMAMLLWQMAMAMAMAMAMVMVGMLKGVDDNLSEPKIL